MNTHNVLIINRISTAVPPPGQGLSKSAARRRARKERHQAAEASFRVDKAEEKTQNFISGTSSDTTAGWKTVSAPKKSPVRAKEVKREKHNRAIPGAVYASSRSSTSQEPYHVVGKGNAVHQSHTATANVVSNTGSSTNPVLAATSVWGKTPPKAPSHPLKTPVVMQTSDPVALGAWGKPVVVTPTTTVSEKYTQPSGPNPRSTFKGRKDDNAPVSKALDGFREPVSPPKSSLSSVTSNSVKKGPKTKWNKLNVGATADAGQHYDDSKDTTCHRGMYPNTSANRPPVAASTSTRKIQSGKPMVLRLVVR